MVALDILNSTILVTLSRLSGGWWMEKDLARCHRCGGMMVYEKIYYETEHVWLWKCIYCGEYIDRVILENRQIQKSGRAKGRKNWDGEVMQKAAVD